MVTIGAVLALVSRSTIGKVVAMWLPIATFFAHGYEHSIVNMFVIPAGMGSVRLCRLATGGCGTRFP